MNQKTVIAIVAVLIIIIGSIYYFRNNYNSINPPENGQQPTVSQGSNQISIKGFAFSPVELNVNAGDTVTWTNNDSASHDISGSGFKSPLMSKGQSYSFTFSESGTYDYFCGIHPSMKGKVIVK